MTTERLAEILREGLHPMALAAMQDGEIEALAKRILVEFAPCERGKEEGVDDTDDENRRETNGRG